MQKRASYETVFTSMPTQDVYIDKEFAKLPTEEISFLHYHEHYEIGICRQGEGIFVTPADAQAVREGDMVFFPPGTRHYSRSLSSCICRFIYVRAQAVEEALTVAVPCVIRRHDRSSAALLLRQLMEDADKPNAHRRILLRMNLFLLEAHDCFSSPVDAPAMGLAEQIAEYLASRYNQPILARELSSRFHLSESQLRRRFCAVYGCSPVEYRNRLRCQIGRELLLHTNRTVAEISEHLGFSAPSDFYRLCLRYCKTSPAKMRRALRQQALLKSPVQKESEKTQ